MLEKKQTKKIEEILTAIDLEQPAPSEEPMRQYYFMEKARRLVKAQSETVGRPLTFHVTTFGCFFLLLFFCISAIRLLRHALKIWTFSMISRCLSSMTRRSSSSIWSYPNK